MSAGWLAAREWPRSPSCSATGARLALLAQQVVDAQALADREEVVGPAGLDEQRRDPLVDRQPEHAVVGVDLLEDGARRPRRRARPWSAAGFQAVRSALGVGAQRSDEAARVGQRVERVDVGLDLDADRRRVGVAGRGARWASARRRGRSTASAPMRPRCAAARRRATARTRSRRRAGGCDRPAARAASWCRRRRRCRSPRARRGAPRAGRRAWPAATGRRAPRSAGRRGGSSRARSRPCASPARRTSDRSRARTAARRRSPCARSSIAL